MHKDNRDTDRHLGPAARNRRSARPGDGCTAHSFLFIVRGCPGCPKVDRDLEVRRSRLGLGPTAESFAVPAALAVETSPKALRFRGPPEAVALLREEFQKLARSQPGAEVRVEGWTFRVQDEVLEGAEDAIIILPWHAWQMVGILLSDVVYGYEPNPFDFSNVGDITLIAEDGTPSPWPRPRQHRRGRGWPSAG